MRIRPGVLAILTVLTLLAAMLLPAPRPALEAADSPGDQWLNEAGTTAALQDLKARVAQLESDYRDNLQVRGIYVPGNLVPTDVFPKLVSLVDRTELNAMVIDVKSDEGFIFYDSQLPIVNEIGAERLRIDNARGLLSSLKQKGIYTIARVVVFKDSELGRGRPSWAIQNGAGQPWRDRTGQIWMDAYNEKVWDYNIAIACEAATLGFDEVQFDYVRFPSDGNVKAASYPAQDGRDDSVVIAQFLQKAADQLDLYGAYASADVFGQIPSAAYDMGIGQQWELLAGSVDYLSPMAYPSHYGPNVYGLPDPDAAPGQTVFHTMSDAYDRFDQLLEDGLSANLVKRIGTVPKDLVPTSENQLATVRPWLQDFTLRHSYGAAQVRAEIEAVYKAGGSQWLLWNPRGRYTESALGGPE